MSNPIQLFAKPLSQEVVDPALQLVGDFDGYTAGEAYDGRLQILNSVGDCRVYIQAGTTLPTDATFSVDQVTKEVVLRWQPASPEQITAVPNGSFEDDGGWTYGPGWQRVSDGNSVSGIHAAVNVNFKGKSLVTNNAQIPCVVGTVINARCSVKANTGSGGDAGLRGDSVSLVWYDTARKEMGVSVGSVAPDGPKPGWRYTDLQVAVPQFAQYVSIAGQCDRARRNKPEYMDDFTWDLQYSPGHSGDDDFFISLMVVDSINRKAFWQGVLSEYYLFSTSRPYTTEQHAELSASAVASASGITLRVPPTASGSESIGGFSLQATGLETRQLLRAFSTDPQLVTVLPVTTELSSRQILRSFVTAPQLATIQVSAVALTSAAVLVSTITQPNNAALAAPTITGLTLS